MAIDIDLQIDGVQGDATDPKHKGWIMVDSYTWGDTCPTGGSTGKGGGKPSFSNLTVQLVPSPASPHLFLASAEGTHYKKPVLEVMAPFRLLDFEFDNVQITSFTTAGAHTEAMPVDTVTLSYAIVRFTFTPVKADGSLGTPVKAGWDVTTNRPA